MKKLMYGVTVLVLLLLGALAASCIWPMSVDYGESADFSREERTELVEKITANLQNCKVYKICYAGDALGEDSLEYCNSLAQARQEEPFVRCAVFEVTFRAPFRNARVLNPGGMYLWTYYFGQRADGTWHLETYGVA